MTKRVFRYDKATGKVVEVKQPAKKVDHRLFAIHVKGAKTIGRFR